VRAERPAHADLAVPLTCCEGEDPIDADAGQNDGNHRKGSEDSGQQAQGCDLLILKFLQ
jgi:hypothetical protein